MAIQVTRGCQPRRKAAAPSSRYTLMAQCKTLSYTRAEPDPWVISRVLSTSSGVVVNPACTRRSRWAMHQGPCITPGGHALTLAVVTPAPLCRSA